MREDTIGAQINLVNASYSALIALTQNSCSASNEHIAIMLMPVLGMLEQTVTAPHANSERNKDVQDMLAGLLQVILVRVGHTVTKEVGDNIVKLLIMMF